MKRFIYKIFFSVFAFILIASNLYSKEMSLPIIRMGYFQIPLHIYQSKLTYKAEGPLVDYFNNYIAKKMKVKFQWIGPYNSFPRLFLEIKENKIDMTHTISKELISEDLFTYSKTPFRVGKSALIVQKSFSLNTIDKKSDLEGNVIGHYLLDKKYLHPLLKSQSIKIEFISGDQWLQRGIKMVDFNRINGFFIAETLPLTYELKRLKLDQRLKIIPMKGKENVLHTAISKFSSNNKKIKKEYDLATSLIKKSYDKFLIEYLSKKAGKHSR